MGRSHTGHRRRSHTRNSIEHNRNLRSHDNLLVKGVENDQSIHICSLR